MCLMGAGQLMYKQWAKGLIYLGIEVLFIVLMALWGGEAIYGFFTLGLVRGDPWTGVEGDNSVVMLLMGILAWFVLIAFVCTYFANIKDCYRTQDCWTKSFTRPCSSCPWSECLYSMSCR